MGYQECIWLLSGHARAYAALAKPEAKDVARLSGVPDPPQKSPICLGCHATAAEVEEWERDDDFVVAQGVQCEKCHGPGSEYMDEAVMRDKQASRAAGLLMPTREDCRGCHLPKESHVRVLKQPAMDMDKAWQKIAHPTPSKAAFLNPHLFPESARAAKPAPQHTGTEACGKCHDGPQHGLQLSKWRLSPHAQAYAALGTPAAARVAREMNVHEEPLTSRACLKCHATAFHDPAGGRLESYAIYEGVGCEACHGAGSRYSPEAVMKDKSAALAAGLKQVTRETCERCHLNAHGKPFSSEEALARIAHPTKLPPESEGVRCKTPLHVAIRPDSSELYVTCEASDSVIVVDAPSRRILAEIPVDRQPHDVAFHPDGRRVYVSSRLEDSVSEISAADRKVIRRLVIGDEPHGLMTDRAGKFLYVANTLIDSISVIDTETFTEVKRLSSGRGPWSMSLSPDGTQLCVTSILSHFVPFRKPLRAEVTIIDTERQVVDQRPMVPGANLVAGIGWHPSGRFALATLNRTKTLVPMTRLHQGWTITNGLCVIWSDGRVDQVLLDEPRRGFPDPTEVAITPDGWRALVTSAGSNRIAVVDVPKMIAMIEGASAEERAHILPNHLGKPTEFVVQYIDTGRCPRGATITRDGRTAFVANSLDDSLTVIDLQRLAAVETIDLGGPKEITQARYGERLFHSADITFHRMFSCHTCHPDGHVDGLTYDIEADGLGVDPVDNRTLRGILDTAPFKWNGGNATLSRQCGPRLAMFFTRLQPFTPEQLEAVDHYICTIPRPPNRYRPLGAPLTEAQRRGRALFARAKTNDGREIPKENRCITCHFPPLYTDRQKHDVGTKLTLDTSGLFDVPHLNNIYDSAPYLHNGIAETLEEIWTKFNPYDTHGVTNDMTKDQLNDLIEYLKTL
jgi:YVTN family beta-propeller protein